MRNGGDERGFGNAHHRLLHQQGHVGDELEAVLLETPIEWRFIGTHGADDATIADRRARSSDCAAPISDAQAEADELRRVLVGLAMTRR